MRRIVVGGLLLLLGLFRFAFGSNPTYYDLTVSPADKTLLKEHSLTIYQPFGLLKPGDKIVSITVGKLPSPNIPCQIYAGVGDGSSILDTKASLRSFSGEIRLGEGNPGSQAVTAALLEHVLPPPAADEKTTMLQSTGAFLASHPLIWIGLGVVLLLGVIVALIRINSTPAGQVPIYGKRAYEENIREVKERLERILEAQEILVRKPPVLRSFRKQIDRFETRLEKLEVTSVSTQQALSVLATSMVDLKEFLEGLSGRQDATRRTVEEVRSELSSDLENLQGEVRAQSGSLDKSIQSLDSRVASQTEQTGALARTLREDLKAQAAETSQTTKTLAGQLASQAEQAQAREKAMAAEFERVHGEFSAAETHVQQLREAVGEQQKATAAGLEQLQQKFSAALAQVQSTLSSQDSAFGERITAIQQGVGEIFAQIQTELAALDHGTAERIDVIQKSFNGISEQLEGLTPLPANVSELHGRVGNLKADIGSLGDKLTQSAAEMNELQRSSVVSFAGMEEKFEGVRGVVADLGTDLARLESEIEVQRSVIDAGSTTLAEISKQVESARENAPTKQQITELEKVPASIKDLRESVSGFGQRLADLGLSKSDAVKILHAHEKLGSLAGDISGTLQKALEQKLTAILAQSIASKKGKESEGSGISDRGAAALSEVAKQLLAEIDHQKNLEQTLVGMMAKVEALPAALQKIDQKLAQPVTVPEGTTSIPVDQILSMIAETKSAVESLPEKIAGLEKGLEDVAAKWVETNQKIDLGRQESAGKWAETAEKLEQSLAEATGKWSETSGKLDQMAVRVEGLASAPLAAPVSPVAHTKAEPEEEIALPKKAGEPSKPKPTMKVEPVETTEAKEIEAFEPQPAPLEEIPTVTHLEVVEEPEASPLELTKPAAKLRKPMKEAPAGAEDWATSSANLSGTWSTVSGRSLSLNADGDAVKRALTPTETPGIEYQIGPMLCTQNRVVYAHGDSLKAFWPGGNERSILLGYAIPDDSWRLLLTQMHIFCVEEKRVEIIDTGSWAKSAHFAGEFLAQSACKGLWAGLRSGANPALEFRDMSGEIVGKSIDLDRAFLDSLPLVSDGEQVWIPAQTGKIWRASPKESELFCDVSGAKYTLLHFLISDSGPIAIVSGPAGVAIKLLDQSGNVQNTVVTDAKQTSGNVSVISNRLFFFDPDRRELNICNLDQMAMENGLELPNVERIRKMAGFGSTNADALMIASCDAAGKLGSVFLLDPESGEQTGLCSTNQPHVDAIFGAGHAIVATSSSYQNIIRVFQPFVAHEGEKAA